MSFTPIVVDRDRYLAQLIRKKWNGMIKIVSGVRRCGKSFLLFHLFKNHLLSEGVPEDHVIEIALDDVSHPELLDGKNLYDYILSRIRDKEDHYILLDEIQLVNNFETSLNTLLRLQNVDIYVTGSNSRFLSSDVITEFRGRGDEVRLYPLSYKEFISAYEGSESEAWDTYLVYGGMPALLRMSESADKMAYLGRLMGEVYLKDIEEHNHIDDGSKLEWVLDLLCSSVGSLTNPHRIANTYSSRGMKGLTEPKISEYIGLLEDAFLFEKAKRFDVKGRDYLGSPYKYYSVDVGLRNARLNFRQQEPTHLIENVIYNELRSRGFSVDVGVVKDRTMTNGVRTSTSYEIDFVANMGSRRYYVQSAFSIDDPDKRAAEIRPFLKSEDGFRKILVIGGNTEPWYDDNGIMTVGIRRFLIDESLMQN